MELIRSIQRLSTIGRFWANGLKFPTNYPLCLCRFMGVLSRQALELLNRVSRGRVGDVKVKAASCFLRRTPDTFSRLVCAYSSFPDKFLRMFTEGTQLLMILLP